MTKSLEDYIETIYVLITEHKSARVKDVAAALSVKMPSVIKAVLELKGLGYAEQERYGDIRLTPSGIEAASAILGRHHLLTAFLEKLGVSGENAEKDACLMEHILSAETLDRISAFVGGVTGGAKPAAKAGKPAKKAKGSAPRQPARKRSKQ